MYTSQTAEDVKVLEWALKEAYDMKSLRFLEVGTFLGDTSREIKKFCDERGWTLEFWGIDSGAHPDFHGGKEPPVPFEGAHMVLGDSDSVFHLIPIGFDVVLLDGCHCLNHVILDTIHYSQKVRPGGILLFHDTSPEIQHTMKDPHGPDIPEFYNSVLDAIRLMNWPQEGWCLRRDCFQKGAPWGGMRAYQKYDRIP